MKYRAYFSITNFLLALTVACSPSFLSAQSDISVNNEAEINTAFQEYSPAFYKNGLVFIGSNPAVEKDKKTDDETGKKATSFFLAMWEEKGNLKKVVPFAEELTTKFYDGPLSFNADGTTVYFTRSNLRRGKAIKAKDGLVKLKIYSAEKTENGWANIAELPINLPEFDCAHPSISPDGKRLYFSSNRPDGFGGMDLYVCTLLIGKWSIPVNCGPKVNTAKNELFPFIHADGTLYFTSNGHTGLGNLDIFYTMKTDTGWLFPRALPEPINSASDDFGLIVSPDKKSGYFSSNRASGKGDDDIFSFIAPNNVNEAVLAITETETQTEQTEAISNRGTPPTPLVASIDPSPLKNSDGTDQNNWERRNNLPKIQIKPTTSIEKPDIKVDNGEMPAESVATLEKTETLQPTSNNQKEEIKVDMGEMPAEITTTVEKQETVKLTPNIPKKETKVEKTEKPATVAANTKKQKPTINSTTTPQKSDTLVEKNKKPAVIAANTKKQKTSTATPNNKVEKTEKQPENTVSVDKQEPFSEAENEVKRPTQFVAFTELPLLPFNAITSMETPKMVDFSSILPILKNKNEKRAEKPQIVADNKPFVSPLDIPKQDLKPIEKPPVEASRSETAFQELTRQAEALKPVVETPKEEVKELVKTEVPVKDNEPIFEKEDKSKLVAAESFIAEVHEIKPVVKDEIKVEKARDSSAVKIAKLEANGTVRKKYLVVVGTYSDKKNALDQQKKATAKGYNEVEIVQYATNHLFGVCVLQSDDEKSAQALARDINKSKAMEAFVKVLK